METRSKQQSSIRKSTRSAIKADKTRQAKLKELYHSSSETAANKNKRTIKQEEREPPATKPTTSGSNRPNNNASSSMAPIRIMSEVVSNTISPEQDISKKATSTVEATADEVTETPQQREARRKAHPLKDIAEPLPTDCLFGRGGGTNHHPGNKLYRKMVEDKKELYLNSKRLDKPLVAMDIIKEWRELDPPGRFLKQDDDTKLWYDVGDKKAREKTSQALREKSCKDREDEYTSSNEKQTRFESGTKLQRGNLVTRDHSLGTEIIGGNDYFSMEGFSWDEHDTQGDSSSSYPPPPHVRETSPRNAVPVAAAPPNSYWAPPPPPPHHHHPSPHHHHYAHPPPPQHLPHHPSPHHYYPPQHDYHHRPSHHDRGSNNSLSMNPLPGASTAKAATNTFDDERSRSSWGHPPSYSYDSRGPPPPLPPPHYYGYGPPPPPPQGWSPSHHHHPHHHYGPPQSAFAPYEQDQSPYYESMKLAGSPQDFTKIADLMSQEEEENETKNNDEKMSRSNSNSSRSIDRSSSWGGYERKHSLVLRDSSIGSFAPFDAEDGTLGGGEFDETAIQRSKSMPYSNHESEDKFPSPPQPLQTRKKPDCVEKEASPVEGADNVDKPSLMRKISGGGLRRAPVPTLDGVVRPEPVKRDTSNQPESMETKRSVKRVVLSRDMSAVARSLKEEQNQKSSSSGPMKAELIDRNLSVEINKLGLGDRPISLSRLTTDQMLTSLLDDDDVQNSLLEPQHLTLDDRLTTLDSVAMGIASGERTRSCDLDDALELIMEDKEVTADAPSAVNEDIAAKWLKGDSFAEDDQVRV